MAVLGAVGGSGSVVGNPDVCPAAAFPVGVGGVGGVGVGAVGSTFAAAAAAAAAAPPRARSSAASSCFRFSFRSSISSIAFVTQKAAGGEVCLHVCGDQKCLYLPLLLLLLCWCYSCRLCYMCLFAFGPVRPTSAKYEGKGEPSPAQQGDTANVDDKYLVDCRAIITCTAVAWRESWRVASGRMGNRRRRIYTIERMVSVATNSLRHKLQPAETPSLPQKEKNDVDRRMVQVSCPTDADMRIEQAVRHSAMYIWNLSAPILLKYFPTHL